MNVQFTRREFVYGGASLVLATCVGVSAACAEVVDVAELMQPSTLGDIAIGSETAPVTIVEYASMTCAHCADFTMKTFPQLKERYIDTGKVRYILREFPLDPLAAGAFMLARCAGKDKYYSLVETLFEQTGKWVVPNPLPPLFAIAKQAGFTQQTFDECLSNQTLLDGLEEVRKRGSDKFKVQSTPTFFINGERLVGAQPLSEFEKLIDKYLKT
jgi:protein-disulfide isomerase